MAGTVQTSPSTPVLAKQGPLARTLIDTNTSDFITDVLDYNELYCRNCKKVIGRYNRRFYTEDKIGDLLKTSHAVHFREGHHIETRIVRIPEDEPDNPL